MAGERSVKIKFTGESSGLDRSVAKSVVQLKRWEDQVERLSRSASRVGTIVKGMIAQSAAPAVAAVGAAAVGTAAAVGAAGAALGVFGAVAKASQAEVTEAGTQIEGLRDKMDLYGRQAEIMAARGEDNTAMLKKQAAAGLELKARIAELPPATREATFAFLQMKSDWGDFVEQNQPATFAIMTRGYALIGQLVGKIQPLFDVGRKAVDAALGSLERYAEGGGIDRLVGFLARNAAPALANIGRIVRNLGVFFGALFSGTVSSGQGFLKFLADASDKLASFATNGGLQQLLDKVTSQGPGAGAALAQIGQAVITIAQAVGPLAPISLAVAKALAAIIAAVPPELITALVAAWIAYTVAMAGYNAVLAITTGVTKAWTAAQKVLTAVFIASPIGLIVAGIVILVAIIVLIATKTDWFQRIWKAAWGAIKAAAGAVGTWFTNTLMPSLRRAFDQLRAVVAFVVSAFRAHFNAIVGVGKFLVNSYIAYINTLVRIFRLVVTTVQSLYNSVTDRFNRLVGFIAGLPGRIASASSRLFDGIKNSFRNAINYIVDRWNNLSFSLPSINTPFGKIGGTTLNTPNIPRLASGGFMTPGRTYLTGENGPELLTSGRPGTFVSNAGDTAGMLGGAPIVQVFIGDREITDIVDTRIVKNNRGLKRRAGAFA